MLKAIFSGLEPCGHLFEILALNANLVRQLVVLLLQLLVLVALLRVQIVQASLIRKVNIIDLLLV